MSASVTNPAEHDLTVVVGSRRVNARLAAWEEAPEDSSQVKLHLKTEQIDLEARSSENYFRCLIELRRQLEQIEARIECYGSCRNVHPSPMIEAMGCAEKAYRLTLGKPASNRDLVSIFDFEDGLPTATIEEQWSFYELWCRSIGTSQ